MNRVKLFIKNLTSAFPEDLGNNCFLFENRQNSLFRVHIFSNI